MQTIRIFQTMEDECQWGRLPYLRPLSRRPGLDYHGGEEDDCQQHQDSRKRQPAPPYFEACVIVHHDTQCWLTVVRLAVLTDQRSHGIGDIMECTVHTVETDVAVIVDGLQVLRAADTIYLAVRVPESIDGAIEEASEIVRPKAHSEILIVGVQTSVR